MREINYSGLGLWCLFMLIIIFRPVAFYLIITHVLLTSNLTFLNGINVMCVALSLSTKKVDREVTPASTIIKCLDRPWQKTILQIKSNIFYYQL
jgi:hypothetical protein